MAALASARRQSPLAMSRPIGRPPFMLPSAKKSCDFLRLWRRLSVARRPLRLRWGRRPPRLRVALRLRGAPLRLAARGALLLPLRPLRGFLSALACPLGAPISALRSRGAGVAAVCRPAVARRLGSSPPPRVLYPRYRAGSLAPLGFLALSPRPFPRERGRPLRCGALPPSVDMRWICGGKHLFDFMLDFYPASCYYNNCPTRCASSLGVQSTCYSLPRGIALTIGKTALFKGRFFYAVNTAN